MPSKPAFGDTSFFFALAALRDPAHAEAVRQLSAFVRSGRPILTTDYILDETLTLTRMRTDIRTSLALLDRIERSQAVLLERICPERFDAAKTFFRRYVDHDYSFTDCTSFVVMNENKVKEALTTDHHFTEAGFRILL